MKISKHGIAFLMAAALVLCTSLQAQQKQLPPAGERAAKITAWMKTNLALTAAQEPVVQEINLRYAGKMDELQQSTATRRQKLETLKANDAAKDAELKKVLTAGQFTTYEAKKDELTQKVKQKAKARKQGGETPM